MEDKYLYMKSKNKCLPYLHLEDDQYIFVGSFKDPVRKGFPCEKDFDEKTTVQIILPIASIIDKRFQVNDEGIIEERDPYCKHCNSHHFIKKGHNWRTICLEIGIFIRVKVKRYQCKRCRLNYQVEFPDSYEKYYTFSVRFQELVRKHVRYGYMSLRHIKNLIKLTMDIDISHESIRKFLMTTPSLYYRDDSFKPSGYYGFDSQWVKISKKKYFRMALFDLVNNRPLAEAIEDVENYETIKDFLNKSVAPKDRIAIVSDNGVGYEKVFNELNFDHQLCTFHLEKNLRELVTKHVNEVGKAYRAELKKNNPKYSKKKLDDMRDKMKKDLKDEINAFVEKFMLFKDQPTWQEARDYIEKTKKELVDYPDFLAEYIWKNFMPIYKKYIKFLEKDYKNKLEPTDNKLENYFGNTLNRRVKNIFRTKHGLFNFIIERKKGWLENNKSALTT